MTFDLRSLAFAPGWKRVSTIRRRAPGARLSRGVRVERVSGGRRRCDGCAASVCGARAEDAHLDAQRPGAPAQRRGAHDEPATDRDALARAGAVVDVGLGDAVASAAAAQVVDVGGPLAELLGAVEEVVAGAAFHEVGAAESYEPVVAIAAAQRVRGVAAGDCVVAVPSLERAFAVELVVAAPALQVVLAAGAAQVVGAVVAAQDVAGRVGRADVLDGGQRVALAGGAVGRGVGEVDGHRQRGSRARGVGLEACLQPVDDGVAARPAVDRVVAEVAEERVVAGCAREPVVARAAVELRP